VNYLAFLKLRRENEPDCIPALDELLLVQRWCKRGHFGSLVPGFLPFGFALQCSLSVLYIIFLLARDCATVVHGRVATASPVLSPQLSAAQAIFFPFARMSRARRFTRVFSALPDRGSWAVGSREVLPSFYIGWPVQQRTFCFYQLIQGGRGLFRAASSLRRQVRRSTDRPPLFWFDLRASTVSVLCVFFNSNG